VIDFRDRTIFVAEAHSADGARKWAHRSNWTRPHRKPFQI